MTARPRIVIYGHIGIGEAGDGEEDHVTTVIAVTSAELVLPSDRLTPSAYVVAPPDRQPLDVALNEVSALLERHGYLIAVYPSSVSPALRQRLHMVRSVLESDRIALVQSDLPPLALAVLVRQLRQLSVTDFSAGVLAAAIRLLAHYIYAGALVNSVAKLDHVPVSLKAHAKSWVPGSQFGVLAAPTPQLIRLGGGSTPKGPKGPKGPKSPKDPHAPNAANAPNAARTLRGPDYATYLTTAAEQLSSDWVSTTLAPQWQVSGVEQATLPRESARWWGTGKLVEFAAAIPDISVLYQLVSSVQRTTCHWCGLQLIGDRCVFCTAPVNPSDHGVNPHSAATHVPAPERGSSRI